MCVRKSSYEAASVEIAHWLTSPKLASAADNFYKLNEANYRCKHLTTAKHVFVMLEFVAALL